MGGTEEGENDMMGTTLDILDAGYVRLIDTMGDDLSIVRNARVSYDAAWRAGEDKGSDTRLINYLYKNGHNTPFECVTFTFEIKAPIFVMRQWMRHRTWSFNEISARYRQLEDEFYIPSPSHIGRQSTDNKQMRVMDEQMDEQIVERNWHTSSRIARSCDLSFNEYDSLIEQGVPREVARCVLPLGTYTHLFATVNLSNLFKFLTERQHEHAQYEIRVYADALLELIRPITPVAIAAFEEGRHE